ncbi:MAG TPA: beta-CASP ribonuclease aCPSF1 [Nitrososphaera sp.]|nr:beta-CASP ribonuclease aCPSF1 [Nitrososphaera sp.]
MQRRSQPNSEPSGQNIMAVILQSLPQEAALTKIEYEGPRIALYSRNPTYLMQNNQLVSNMVNTIKKRIVVRTDEGIRRPQPESAKIIEETIPDEVGISGTFFDPVLGEATVFVRKPWMLAQIGEEFDNLELAEKTGWKVRVRKAPHDLSAVASLYSMLSETATERTKFFREVGDKIFRDPLVKSAEASLVTLGGFAEVGRSCILLSTPESKVLLDCGINASAKDSLTALPRFDVAGVGSEDIDAVVLTHAHIDHTGFLPALFKYGYRGPVYCTEPTMLLMGLLQRNYLARTGSTLYSEKDIDNALMHVITLTSGIVTDISPDVKLVLYNAGHILGSTSIHLHIGNGDHNIVYTGDFKFGRTLSLENASWNFPRVETLIIESTFGGKEDILPRPEEAENAFAELITGTVTEGGHLLLPVPAAGISQELILVLDRLIKQSRIPAEARILVEKSVSEATSVYEAYPEYLSRELREQMLRSEGTPFGIPGRLETVSSATLGGTPSIILAPSSMLLGGPSTVYLEQIAADSKSRLAMVSYQAPDSPGRAILEGSRKLTIRGREIELQCKVDRLDGFSSHSSYEQLIAYVLRLKPKLRRVLVNHGERAKAQNLASSINKMFKIQTQHPLVQEAIKLL